MIRLPPRSTLFPYRDALPILGGMGSSDDAAITGVDGVALGYAEGDVIEFSYRGGRVPDPTDRLGSLPATSYAPQDSSRDLRRSEEHTSELQSRQYLVCRLLLE